jgi:hypothetical protein
MLACQDDDENGKANSRGCNQDPRPVLQVLHCPTVA